MGYFGDGFFLKYDTNDILLIPNNISLHDIHTHNPISKNQNKPNEWFHDNKCFVGLYMWIFRGIKLNDSCLFNQYKLLFIVTDCNRL